MPLPHQYLTAICDSNLTLAMLDLSAHELEAMMVMAEAVVPAMRQAAKPYHVSPGRSLLVIRAALTVAMKMADAVGRVRPSEAEIQADHIENGVEREFWE